MRRTLMLGLVALVAAPAAAPATESTVMVSRMAGLSGAPLERGQVVDVSSDGRYALMASPLDLTDISTRDSWRLYRRDLLTGETVLVSRADGPDGGALETTYIDWTAISGDGRYVVFSTDRDGREPSGASKYSTRVYRRDVDAGTTVLVSRADGADGRTLDGAAAAVSDDGSRVLFRAEHDDVDADAPNSADQAWVRDVASAETIWASRADGDDGGPLGARPDEALWWLTLSGDGATVVWSSPADPTAGGYQVYARDLDAGRTELLSQRPADGAPAEGASFASALDVSDDGTRVLFIMTPRALLDNSSDTGMAAFVRDRETDETIVAGRADGLGGRILESVPDAALSGDGTTVAFGAWDADLAASYGGSRHGRWPSQIYARDLRLGTTTLESRGQNERPALEGSGIRDLWVSRDGTDVGFQSDASGLVADMVGRPFGGFYVRGGLAPTALPDGPPTADLRGACAKPCRWGKWTMELYRSVDLEAPLAGWTLDFGDGSAPASGTTDDIPDATHVYPDGRFTAQLTVTDSAGQTSTAGLPIDNRIRTRLAAAPIASAQPPGVAGVNARLTVDRDGTPVAGQELRFTDFQTGTVLCVATTDADGRAACPTDTLPLAVARGGYRVRFAGDEDHYPSGAGRRLP